MGLIAKLIQWLLFPILAKRFRDLGNVKKSTFTRPHFEVERKYQISEAEFEKLPHRLRALGFARSSKATIADSFVPAEKDGDMIRVRDEVSGESTKTVITLKEWEEVSGGRERKERESEPIDDVARDCVVALGRRLKKGELMSFSKERTTYSGFRNRRNVTVALDIASGLGQYSGTYLEIEVIVERHDEVAAARAFVEDFVVELLGSKRENAISYMEMLKLSRQKSS
ncbi:MAG: CYTH domain-containing protein [Candidatus Obscuribacterales bacterium]|nr:CYTH domain-containing protein [Candidatus Obscuribacterales bacterium]